MLFVLRLWSPAGSIALFVRTLHCSVAEPPSLSRCERVKVAASTRYTRSILWVFGWPPSLWIKQSSFTVGGWLPVCWFVADLFLFLIFQMSAISCVLFGLQLWNPAGWNLVRLFVSCFIHMRNSRQHFLNVEPTAQRSLFPKNLKPWPNGLASRSK